MIEVPLTLYSLGCNQEGHEELATRKGTKKYKEVQRSTKKNYIQFILFTLSKEV